MSWTDVEPDATAAPLVCFIQREPFLNGLLALQLLRYGHTVWVRQHCMHQIMEHLQSKTSELGGLLLGRAYIPRELAGAVPGSLTIVEDTLESYEFKSTSVSLAMGTEVWDRARALVGPEKLIVGWYHSHPNLGAFFSGTDRATQRSFFFHPYSVGLVIDPCKSESAWFSGPKSAPIAGQSVLFLS